jgi:hypothetical protein
MKIDWHEELIKRGFKLLVSNTSIGFYGCYKDDKFIFSGSIEYERKGKILDPDFEPKFVDKKMIMKYYPDDAVQVFYPFIRTEDDKRPNHKFNSVRIADLIELDQYINQQI